MILVNGQRQDRVAVADRGLHYGDGVFETMAVRDGRVEFLDRHLCRLSRGCERLSLPPLPALDREISRVCDGVNRGVLKLIWTRGSSGRGYRAPAEVKPTRILSMHPWPEYPQTHWGEGVRVQLCKMRLGQNERLAGIKHLNRLEQVLARLEWNDETIAEGLMLDRDDHVIGGTMTNLFCVSNGVLVSPAIEQAGIAGVLREIVLERSAQLGLRTAVRPLTLADVRGAEELFLTNSIIRIWPVREFVPHRYAKIETARALLDAITPGEFA